MLLIMARKRLYHGTNNANDIIRYGFRKSNVGLYGDGVYFFQNKNSALLYGDEIIKVYADVRKPFDFSTEKQKLLFSRLYKKHKNRYSSFPTKDTINELHYNYGYDAFRFIDFSRSRRGLIAWNIFEPEQIHKISKVTS